eukprot:3934088-Rhodomonas_salina.2
MSYGCENLLVLRQEDIVDVIKVDFRQAAPSPLLYEHECFQCLAKAVPLVNPLDGKHAGKIACVCCQRVHLCGNQGKPLRVTG